MDLVCLSPCIEFIPQVNDAYLLSALAAHTVD